MRYLPYLELYCFSAGTCVVVTHWRRLGGLQLVNFHNIFMLLIKTIRTCVGQVGEMSMFGMKSLPYLELCCSSAGTCAVVTQWRRLGE